LKLLLPNHLGGEAPHFYVADDAVRISRDFLAKQPRVAVDIETRGLGELSYHVKAIIISTDTTAVVLDATNPAHKAVCHDVLSAVPQLVFHNSAFDAPPLYTGGFMPLDAVHKIYDTLITARLRYTGSFDGKGLGDLEPRLLSDQFLHAVKDRMGFAAKVHGFSTKGAAFEVMQYTDPVYVMYAAWDAIVTSRLVAPLTREVRDWSLDHPFGKYGPQSTADVDEIVDKWQRINRVYVYRSCVGIDFDPESMRRQTDALHAEMGRIATSMSAAGVTDPSNRNQLIASLEAQGAIEPNHPRTDKGALKTSKEVLEAMPQQLAKEFRAYDQHRRLAHYMEEAGRITDAAGDGKLHPRVNVLGAATGRVSYSDPPLQQFTGDARSVIVDDRGLTSIDYASVEPLLAASLSGDRMVLDAYDAEEDFYVPMAEAAGIKRKEAKIQSLADLYGQGVRAMMTKLGIDAPEAMELRSQLRSRMPRTGAFIEYSRRWSEATGKTFTLDGRIVKVDLQFSYKGTNYSVQGSGSDLLHYHVDELYKAGAVDGIILTMHDEIVCTDDIADLAHDIMRTPSPRLVELSGRSNPIRTDRQEMGRHWQQV
jgi:DNA polymerase I-like protein with 3'-5' exonuclease and polymerase domains